MSNFDFLRDFNYELYEIGARLENDVQTSPRAVTADATTFLELLVDDIYLKSENKLNYNKLPFYKKIDKLYRLGEISYIFKNKLHDAYNLRNEIHNDFKNIDEEFYIALELHQKLYYISKKYYRDYNEDYDKYDVIPSYRPLKLQKIKKITSKEYHFDECIICGNPNGGDSNMCEKCNEKIENANYFMSIRNHFGKDNTFTKNDLIDYGIPESYSLSFIMQLTRNNLIKNRGNHFAFNNDVFDEYLSEINSFIEISMLINKLYNDEITPKEIKNTSQYMKSLNGEKNYAQFYKTVNNKLIKIFEDSISNLEEIEDCMDNATLDYSDVFEWYLNEMNDFIAGKLNDAFINFNDMLFEDYVREIKKGCFDESKIQKKLKISPEIYDFWIDYYIDEDLEKVILESKKAMIIREARKNRTLKSILKSVNLSYREFTEIYDESHILNDQFYTDFKRDYVLKRQNMVIKFLKHYDLSKSVIKAKITKKEFCKWYFDEKLENSKFFIKSSEILSDKFLKSKKEGKSTKTILKEHKIPVEIFEVMKEDETFRLKMNVINTELSKRDLIINGLKQDMDLDEILESNDMEYCEFKKLYDDSKRIKSEFYKTYDYEFGENRKRLFLKHLENNDFLNAVVKSDISIRDFNKWYVAHEREFLSNNNPSEFYIRTTRLLMDKYLKARFDGKSKVEASKLIGFENNTINYWINHDEIPLFDEFKTRLSNLKIKLVVKSFTQCKSKVETSKENDISLKEIDDIIENDNKISDLYLNKVIPRQLKIFLEEIKTKPLKKSLNNSFLTSEEIEYYYSQGKNGDESFSEFYQNYLEFKIKKYVSEILSKKPQRIAFKNSYLTKEEFSENESEISDKILRGRVEIMMELMLKKSTKGSSLAHAANISLDEVYDLYFRGKEGDEKLEYYALCFDLNIVLPRKMSYQRGLSLGFHKNKLLIKIRKELGNKEYAIWEKHNLIGDCGDVRYIELSDDCGNVDTRKAYELMTNSKRLLDTMNHSDYDSYEYLKHAFKSIM